MLKQAKPEVIQETHVQPPILQTTDADYAIQQVQSPPASSGGRHDAISRQRAASQGLTQTFGLDFRAAMLTVLVDLMVFGGDAFSLGFLIPLGIIVAAILAFIVYRIQIKWYGDDHDSALIKALVVGLLVAIPAPLAPLIAVPGGILGIVNAVRRK